MSIQLLRNEHIADYKCPICGSDVIVNCGPGIELDYCTNPDCDYEDYDYPEILDEM